MSQPDSTSSWLLEVAAESIGPVIGGCAGLLVPGFIGVVGGAIIGKVVGKVVQKGINYFGPRIVDGWWSILRERPLAERQAAVETLANLTQSQAQALANQVVDRVAPDASPEDRQAAATYLASIPAAARRSMIADKTGRMTCPSNLLSSTSQGLSQLLPTDLPPFATPSDLPDTPYHLEEIVGTGGFGVVYRARTNSLQNLPLAIKFCLDSRMQATLQQERKLLDKLQQAGHQSNWSDYIVKLYGYHLEYPVPFLVYEFVAGGDLTGYLTAKKQKTGKGLSPDEALAVVGQIARALAFAHDQGLVHRDLKPANVLLQGNRLKLADFGISGVVADQAVEQSRMASTSRNRLTTGEQADLFRGSGTLLYMCREQQRGDAPDPRHDIFSLGVVWYQLLTGDVTHGPGPDWDSDLEENHSVPREHVELIRQCVGLFPKRPANGRALLTLLKSDRPTDRKTTQSPPASSGPTPEEARDKEFERLRGILAVQMARGAWSDAEVTVAAMLRLKPGDADILATRAHIQKASLPEVIPIPEARLAPQPRVVEPLARRSRSRSEPREEPPAERPRESECGWATAFFLSLFLGSFGMDRFYLGYTGLGLLKLFTGGGCGILAAVDSLMLVFNLMPDARGLPLRGGNLGTRGPILLIFFSLYVVLILFVLGFIVLAANA